MKVSQVSRDGRLTKTQPSMNREEDREEEKKKDGEEGRRKNRGRSLSKYVNQILCVVG